MNNITITGRLTADPELRTTPNGINVTQFNVAVDRRFQAKDEEKHTDFFRVIAWRSTADFICRYFGKGRLILITGEMQSRKYTDKYGNERIAWELLADKVEFMGDKPADSSANAQQSAPAGAPPAPTAPPATQTDDDYPF